jgi:hypothetical protein
MTSFQGAVLQKAGWPRFSASGDIVEYTEFKKQWHKIDKTGVGDKKVLKIMWEYCLPKNLTKDPGRFADVDAVWAWLEKLFGPNEICYQCQGIYGKCPKDADPVLRYEAMINLRKEVWDDGNQDWWNMAAVDEILDVLPEGERQVWSQFIIEEKARWIEHWPINFWRFLHYRCGQLERASRGWMTRKAFFAEQRRVNRENDLELALQQSAVSAQTLAGQHAVQPGSARFGSTHECSECRGGSQVENPSGDDWRIPEGASLRRVDDAFGECTDDWSIPEVTGQKRPS